MEEMEIKEREKIFSKVVRAGKRTYFFDVQATKTEELFLTITESKKKFRTDGKFFYEKHKIFLYKEDFENFVEMFNETLDYIKSNQVQNTVLNYVQNVDETLTNEMNVNEYSDISFDDLGSL